MLQLTWVSLCGACRAVRAGGQRCVEQQPPGTAELAAGLKTPCTTTDESLVHSTGLIHNIYFELFHLQSIAMVMTASARQPVRGRSAHSRCKCGLPKEGSPADGTSVMGVNDGEAALLPPWKETGV